MLYFVATPIGNLNEITLRALEVLKTVDLIAAEDTRHTAILLEKYGITTRMTPYHKFNERGALNNIIELLSSGKSVAVVSDAGMPCISDPGHILIKDAIARNIPYTVISGACAAINALVLSGFDTRAFTFLGFLPEKNSAAEKYVKPYAALPSPLVFYSAVHDINKDLAFLYKVLGARRVAVCRELTKKFETVIFGTLGEDIELTEKGEFVVVVDGAEVTNELCELTVEQHLRYYLNNGMAEKDAVKQTAKDRGVEKNAVYRVAVMLKNDKCDAQES